MLVDGVTKISSIKNRSKSHAQAETLRKMLLATVKDIRVIIIKLADKLHNMQTIMFHSEIKRHRIAKETLDIYAPIARRLGISRLGSELEDLSFHVLYPEEYKLVKNGFAQRQNEVELYIENFRDAISEKLADLGIEAQIKGRAKSYYSVFKKMQLSDKPFEDIYDIRGIRIITRELRDCYAILGIVHSVWSPVEGRFKDYIAVPKSNMYQSLHTTVIGPEGYRLEVQIRTNEMDATAEMGIAAHWIYKEGKKFLNKDYKDLSILKSLSNIDDSLNTRDFVSTVKMDLFEDEIFVFTPKGKIVKLPKGSTPVDFAFAIHTEVGYKCSGAKVNNKLVPLRSKLKSGDIVEIQSKKDGKPSEAWIKFVKSANARYKIRNWFRRHSEDAGRQEEELRRKEEKKKKETKKVSVSIPADQQPKLSNYTKESKVGISIEGNSNVLIKLAQCCQPIPGDEVVGFITRGRGITVHKKTCPSLERLMQEKERIIEIMWQEDEGNRYPIKVAVEAVDRPNLLKDVTDEISLYKSNIIKVEAQLIGGGKALLKFILEVRSNAHLGEISKGIKKLKNVTNVYKINEKVILK
jgi:GTP pyrophosphokinase